MKFPLNIAAQRGLYDVVSAILESGKFSPTHTTALAAAHGGDRATFELVLNALHDRGASVLNEMLRVATLHNNEEIKQLLEERGAEIVPVAKEQQIVTVWPGPGVPTSGERGSKQNSGCCVQ